MYRHSNENLRRPLDYDRTPNIHHQDRLPARPDDRHPYQNHHQHQHQHQQQHHQHPHQHPHQHHPDQRRSLQSNYHFDSRNPQDSRVHHIERIQRPPFAGPPRIVDRNRSEYIDRPSHLRPPSHQVPFEDNNRRPYEDLKSRAYEDTIREPHNRRIDDFPTGPRSARYNPYPPTAPRADAHPSPVGRAPNGPLGHPPYHSSGGGVQSYEDRVGPGRSHEHGAAGRGFDPNGQFNHGPPKDKSPPSQSVIFMGLPIHTDEANLRAFLEEWGASVDSVTIIYDRVTGQSKRYGFARFVSVEHARAFVEPSFPMVVWKEPAGSRFDRSGDGLKVKIDYSQKEKVPFEVRQREREGIQRTPVPFLADSSAGGGQQSYSYRSASDSSLSALNDGARDIGGTPTAILLLRGLDPLSTETEIAQHLQHIPDPSQTVLPESIRKVMLIKDRTTKASWGYAFVQFADVQVAVKALSLLLNTSLFPRGFQIRSRTITVTFAHEHSFHPVYTPSDWSFRGLGGQELAYWDDKAYAALYVSPSAPTEAGASGRGKAGGGREQDAEMDALLMSIDAERRAQGGGRPGGRAPEGAAAKAAEHDGRPQSRGRDKGGEGGLAVEKTRSGGAGAGAGEGSKNDHHTKEAKSEKKRGAEPIATKKMVANIQKWQSKHQEITQDPGPTDDLESAQVVETGGAETEGSGENNNNEDDFSDLNRLTCMLCQRQFKSPEDLGRHNSLSNLHKGNLQNEKLKRAARLRKAASSKPSSGSVVAGGGAGRRGVNGATEGVGVGRYTDRAAARREAFGQPDTPGVDRHEAKKARYEPAPAAPVPPPQPDKDGIQATNVGSKMLEKMGWQKGEGLGNGNGRVDPVVAAQYAKGVGLGASSVGSS